MNIVVVLLLFCSVLCVYLDYEKSTLFILRHTETNFVFKMTYDCEFGTKKNLSFRVNTNLSECLQDLFLSTSVRADV
jgi:hypothetical protein